MGGGVAFFDFDNDGDQDLLLVDSRSWPWRDQRVAGGIPQLFANNGAGGFTNVTQDVGLDAVRLYGMGVAIADVNGDGFRDIYLTAVGKNKLLISQQGKRFMDETDTWGVAGADQDWSSSAAFFDMENDGDLDLIVANYVEWSREIDQVVDYRLTGVGRAYGPPTNYAGTHSRLFERTESGFVDVSASAGIQVNNPATSLPAGKALGVLPADLDQDGLLDLVVANDTVQNFLFHNRGDGTFEEVGMASGLAFDNTGNSTGAMGLDLAYLDDQQNQVIAVGNFANEMTSFYMGPRNRLGFTDQSIVSGIGPGSRQALSFGLFFFDVDLDGRLDMLQTNGHVEDEINVVQPSQHYEQPTQLFWNCGSDCPRRFVLLENDGLADLSRPIVGRGASYADIDNDGDLDVLITQVGRSPLLLRNDQQTGHGWLRLDIGGYANNQDAIGARVEVQMASGQIQERVVMPSRSYLAQTELPITIGMAAEDGPVNVTVTWPDGQRTSQTIEALNRAVKIAYPQP